MISFIPKIRMITKIRHTTLHILHNGIYTKQEFQISTIVMLIDKCIDDVEDQRLIGYLRKGEQLYYYYCYNIKVI